MKLVFVRHGLAGDKLEFAFSGKPDSERPLTAKGAKKMKKAAAGLKKLIGRPDSILSSPYARARRTAAIIGAALGARKIDVLAALEPAGRPGNLLKYLSAFAAGSTVVLVGHEPHLGTVISECLAGRAGPFISLGKGGACLLEFKGKPAPGKAGLVWLLEPEHLRSLA